MNSNTTKYNVLSSQKPMGHDYSENYYFIYGSSLHWTIFDILYISDEVLEKNIFKLHYNVTQGYELQISMVSF